MAFLCPNTPHTLEAHNAVPMTGAALVTINIRLSSREIAYIINHSDAKALFVDNEFAEVINPIRKELTKVDTVVNICDISAERPLDGLEYKDFWSPGCFGNGRGSYSSFEMRRGTQSICHSQARVQS
jgi:fatty-acyl-CoA synthase